MVNPVLIDSLLYYSLNTKVLLNESGTQSKTSSYQNGYSQETETNTECSQSKTNLNSKVSKQASLNDMY